MNEKCNLVTVLLLCCLIFPGNAQEFNWQDLVNRKQYAAVIAHADSLTLADSSNYEIMNAIGQAYEGMLRYQKAYDYYRLCFSMDTTNLDILNILARTATNLGRAEDAERYFHQVLSADSSNFYANYQLARLYFQLGEYEKAVDAYEKLQAQNEDNTVLYRAIGDCYTRMEQYPSATTAYFQAYNLNRENAGLAVALVNSLYRMGASSPDYISEGIAICDTALFYNPGNRQLLRSKGLGLYIVKQFVQADSVYSSLLADGDSTYLTLKYGGASKYYAGLYMPSVDILDMAYEQDTTSVEVCLLLGSALGKTYDRKRAYDLFDRLSDRVAILRHGQFVGDMLTRETNAQEMTNMMVGRPVTLNIDRPAPVNAKPRIVVEHLTVKDLEGTLKLDDVSFTANSGEILGIAGISGCGQKELLEAIAGLQPTQSGSIRYVEDDGREEEQIGRAHV